MHDTPLKVTLHHDTPLKVTLHHDDAPTKVTPTMQVLNSARTDGHPETTMTPEISPGTEIPDWMVPYVLSGARVGGRSVYRFTPRCLMNEVVVAISIFE